MPRRREHDTICKSSLDSTKVLTPLAGLDTLGADSPGRCPGLFPCRAFGAQELASHFRYTPVIHKRLSCLGACNAIPILFGSLVILMSAASRTFLGPAGESSSPPAAVNPSVRLARVSNSSVVREISAGYFFDFLAMESTQPDALPAASALLASQASWPALAAALAGPAGAGQKALRRAAFNRLVAAQIVFLMNTGIERGAIPRPRARAYLLDLWLDQFPADKAIFLRGPQNESEKARLEALRQNSIAPLWKSLGWDRATWKSGVDFAALKPETVVLKVMAAQITWADVQSVLGAHTAAATSAAAANAPASAEAAPAASEETLRNFVDLMLIWRDARALAVENPAKQLRLDVREEADLCEAWLAKQGAAYPPADASLNPLPLGGDFVCYALSPFASPEVPLVSRTPRPGYPAPPTVAREGWNAAPADVSRLLPQGAITWITVHHGGTRYEGKPPAPTAIKNLQGWGMREKSWGDVPYHFEMDRDGKIYACRDLSFAGDTNTSYNPRHHALPSVMGNYEEQALTLPQENALIDLCAWLCSTYRIPPERIRSHRDWVDTLCPGANLYPLIATGELSRQVAERLDKANLLEPEAGIIPAPSL